MMTSPHNERMTFGARLLQQDEHLSAAEYEEYRVKLDVALNRAERSEKLLIWVAAVSFAVAVALMFVGGDQTFGPFDPSEPGANAVSITLGVIYVVAGILFWLSLAAYFLRYRPRLTQAKLDIRDANILTLKGEISELREQLAGISASHKDGP